MTVPDRWILPEGVDEVLPEQAILLEHHRRRLLDLYRSWGYAMVVPPFIEYLESLLIGASHDLDLQTFKLTDQLNGRTMGVRADMTPQVARIDSHVLQREAPARLCYFGTVLRTRMESVGDTRSPMQVGAELYGHAGADSDLEVIRLLLESLDVLAVRHVHLDLGHVGIYGGLARQAGLDREQEFALFDLMQRKARPEIDVFLRRLDLSGDLRAMLAALSELHGGEEVLARARTVLDRASEAVISALEYLERVSRELRRLAPDLEVHCDLAELRGYHYHTGVVFAAYVAGHGEEIARGGRYDNIGRDFGRARPATGFSADLKVLCKVSEIETVDQDGLIFVEPENVPAAQAEISRLRALGKRVVCGLSGQEGSPEEMGCDAILVRDNDRWITRGLD